MSNINKLRKDTIADLQGLLDIGSLKASTFKKVVQGIKKGAYDEELSMRDEGLKQHEVTDYILSIVGEGKLRRGQKPINELKKRAMEIAGLKPLNEGMSGWKNWNDSDAAAGFFYDLEEKWNDVAGTSMEPDPADFIPHFKTWLADLLVYDNPYGTDLGGAESLALISKDKFWKMLMKDPDRKKVSRPYIKKAIQKLETELKQHQKDLKFNQDDEDYEAVGQISDWIKTGLKPMIAALKKA